jgi:hypothetical protein
MITAHQLSYRLPDGRETLSEISLDLALVWAILWMRRNASRWCVTL